MPPNPNNRVCPAEHAGALDINLRKLVHNPKKILRPYISEGMTALDLGCGPGFFTLTMAEMVGKTGKVIAADLQEEMLQKVKQKIQRANLQNIIELHKCQSDRIGLSEKVDCILLFYMLHEVPDQTKFLQEVMTLLKPAGKVLIVEPKGHVTKNDFRNSTETMKQVGFEIIEEPRVFFSRSVVVKRRE